MKKEKSFNLDNFALMQGRLVDSEKKNEIQFFPKKNWKKELKYFKKIRSSLSSGLQVTKIW